MFKRFVARQLLHPSGWIGRHLLPAVWNRRNAALNRAALARLALAPGDRVLEVGFGGGYLMGLLLEGRDAGPGTLGHLSGADASPLLAERARRRFVRAIADGRLDIACAPVEALPYADGSFAKAVSVNSLFYWPSLTRGLREMGRVLAPGGRLVLVYTCRADLDRRAFGPHGVRGLGDEEVLAALREAGFGEAMLEYEADRYRRFAVVTAKRR